jgi:hypothetical protein
MTRLLVAPAHATWRRHRLLTYVHNRQLPSMVLLLLLLALLLLLPHLCCSWAEVGVDASGGGLTGASGSGPAQYEWLLGRCGAQCLQHHAHVEHGDSLGERAEKMTKAAAEHIVVSRKLVILHTSQDMPPNSRSENTNQEPIRTFKRREEPRNTSHCHQ